MQKAKNLKSSNNIKMICLAGVMAALYVCLDFLAVSVSAPFGNLPNFHVKVQPRNQSQSKHDITMIAILISVSPI